MMCTQKSKERTDGWIHGIYGRIVRDGGGELKKDNHKVISADLYDTNAV